MKLRRWVLGEILMPPVLGKEKAVLCVYENENSPFQGCFFISEKVLKQLKF